jgi:hypothetical protein
MLIPNGFLTSVMPSHSKVGGEMNCLTFQDLQQARQM